jgi:glutamate N-acetyltransferase / amino-acid N-acetyltransferase
MALTWPAGVRSSGVSAGIKEGGEADLGIMALEAPGAWAGTFTRSGAAAAPVRWSRALIGRPLRAVVVNSGNANACTGAAGEIAVAETARAAAAEVGCSPQEIAVASTGPIGIALPVAKVLHGIPSAVQHLSPDAASFAHAILTTDSKPKLAHRGGAGFEVAGVAKGAAMLAPNMATMLAFVATDAALPPAELQAALTRAVATTFDRIDVDGCQSTNDSVFLLSSGAAGPVGEAELAGLVKDVCADLAEQMVRDAEGGSRFVRIRVTGADDEASAEALARGVAASALWRAAVHGGDPNWGRVAQAIGAALPGSAPLAYDIWIDGVQVCAGGVAIPHEPPVLGDEVEYVVGLPGEGAETEVFFSDLSHEYVTINAEYTT